jgi:Na+/H+-dicarboxylate symporter
MTPDLWFSLIAGFLPVGALGAVANGKRKLSRGIVPDLADYAAGFICACVAVGFGSLAVLYVLKRFS